jgi:acetyl-CoA synthetase
MQKGEGPVEGFDLSSLRVLGTVGEPINPEAWRWYHDVVGRGRCPIVDTWWQTETGGMMLSPQVNAGKALWPLKPGCATMPFLGVEPAVMDPKELKEIPDQKGKEASGHLCIKAPWPGMMRTLWGDHARFEEVYFSQFDGYYTAGDGCRRDADGYYWVTGRVDDVLVVSGHNIGTAEVESAFVANTDVAETAVVGFPHTIKGEAIYAYVTLKDGVVATAELKAKLMHGVGVQLGKFASPDIVHWAPALPKTRSGKIMRRILRKIADPKSFAILANGDLSDLGDISTLAEPSVVQDLIDTREWKAKL